jgi:hypothetical protein
VTGPEVPPTASGTGRGDADELARLKEENARLKRRIRHLEAAGLNEYRNSKPK